MARSPLGFQPTNENWAGGYAKQALSDLRARQALASADVEKCHRLHFLQMAAEKVCKAHLTISQGYNNVRKSHACVTNVLPIIARYFYAISNDDNRIAHWEMQEIRRLSKEIELLALACDGGNLREDNSEYPWEDGAGLIRVPCDYSFPNLNDGSREIVRLIKLIRIAAESYVPRLEEQHPS